MKRLKTLIIAVLIGSSLVLLIAQCIVGNLQLAIIGKKIWLNDDNSLLRQEVRHHIPIGSSITDANSLLILNGFKCRYTKNSDSPSDDWNTIRTSKDGDYLFCYLEVSRLVCATTYKPFIYYKNEIVTNVDTAVGGWCL
jgi:hypothetical protein